MARPVHVLPTLIAVGLCTVPAAVLAADPHDPEHEGTTEEVVVTGSPLDRGSDQLSTSTLTLSREQVLSHLRATLGDTLANEPGISTSGFATGASRPVIRGQDALRVQVLQNGIGTHDVSTLSPDHGVPVNPLTTRRIEVVRGPAALRYGGGAIGGVVNALTNRVPRFALDRPLRGEVFSGFGIGPNDRLGAFVLEGQQGPIAWHVDGLRQDSGDHDAPRGAAGSEIQNSDVDAYGLAGGAAWIGEAGRLGLAFERYVNEYGIPQEEAFIDLQQNAWQLEGDLNTPVPGIEVVRLRGRTSDYEHGEVVPTMGTQATFDNEEREARLELIHAPVGDMQGALGIFYRTRDFRAGGEAVEFLAPTDTDTWAAYLWEEIALGERVRLQVGGRVEDTEVSGTPLSGSRTKRDFHPVCASAGLVVDLDDTLTAGLTLSAMERAPDAVELFARGPHEATETFERGSSSLDEERSLSAELRLEGERGKASGEINLFYTSYDDYIFGQRTGRTCDEMGSCVVGMGNELTELSFVQEDADFYGGEARASLELAELAGGHLGIDAQLDVVRGRLDRSGNVPRQPPVRYGAGVHFANDQVRGRIGFLRNREQHREGAGETETGGYTNVEASLIMRVLEQGERSLELHTGVSNLFDERGRNHLNFRKDEVVLPGRVIRFAIHGTF